MTHPVPSDRNGQPVAVSTDDLWTGCHNALKARNMQAVVDFLHVLAPRDPHGVETFLTVVDLVTHSDTDTASTSLETSTNRHSEVAG